MPDNTRRVVFRAKSDHSSIIIRTLFETYLLLGISLLVELVAVDLDLALVERVQAELVQDATANQQTSAVSSGVVGETDGDTIAWELVSIGGADNDVTLETGIGHLGDDVLEI